jgi:N-formylmaleamate deformylase
MSEWQSGYVMTNGIRTHYTRTGGDKPPLVLAHGSTDSGLCWTRVAKELEADYDVIMPDSRGHGFSEAPKDGYNPDERAADLADLIRALGLGKPIVGGHSMGGAAAFYLAAEYPGLVRAAILEDPPFWAAAGAPPTPDQLARREAMRQRAAEQAGLSRDELIALCHQRNPVWHDDEVSPWADAKMRVSPRHLNAGVVQARLSWREAIRKIDCPALLITADPALGAIITPEQSAEAAEVAPSFTVANIPHAGHNIRREQFEAYMSAVKAFLARF